MKIAIVHDWLTGMRGGEKCLEVFCELFPQATLFTLLHKKGSVSRTIERMDIKQSFLQHLPKIFSHYRYYLPLFPYAIERFDLKGYDLVLSSSHCVAKGVRIPKSARHICYCYTPMRYAWIFFSDYFGSFHPLKKYLIRLLIARLKNWDLKTNENVDFFIAISDNIRKRIQNIYHRQSEVIYPPVDVHRFQLSDQEGDFYLIVSALVPYKKIDIAIQVCNALRKKLIIIGTGDAENALKKLAGPTITFLGWRSDEEILSYYQKCKALIFPGEEDFGIVPVEAQACGKPVIAYAQGGALETVTQETGVFFYAQTAADLADAVKKFEIKKSTFNSQLIRQHALKFSRPIFKDTIKRYIEKHINA